MDKKENHKADQVKGAAKETLGKVTGDKETETKGAVEKTVAKAKEVADNLKDTTAGIIKSAKDSLKK